MGKRLNETLLEEYIGQRRIGVIRSYDRAAGYGFIYSNGIKDLFLSSYELDKKKENLLHAGIIVSFTVARNDHNGKICAREVKILEDPHEEDFIVLPDGWSIPVAGIIKITKIYISKTDDKSALAINCKKVKRFKREAEEYVFHNGECYDAERPEPFNVKEYYHHLMSLLLTYDEETIRKKYNI